MATLTSLLNLTFCHSHRQLLLSLFISCRWVTHSCFFACYVFFCCWKLDTLCNFRFSNSGLWFLSLLLGVCFCCCLLLCLVTWQTLLVRSVLPTVCPSDVTAQRAQPWSCTQSPWKGGGFISRVLRAHLSLSLLFSCLPQFRSITSSPSAPLISSWLLSCFWQFPGGINWSVIWSNEVQAGVVFETSLQSLFWPKFLAVSFLGSLLWPDWPRV